MTHAEEKLSSYERCFQVLKQNADNHQNICNFIASWMKVSGFAQNIDSVRLFIESRCWIYFKDGSAIHLNNMTISQCIPDLRTVHNLNQKDLVEIIWPKTIEADDTFCIDCTWRGPVWEPCPEHGERSEP